MCIWMFLFNSDQPTQELHLPASPDHPGSSEGQSPDKAVVPQDSLADGRGGHVEEDENGRSVPCETERKEES